MTTCNRTSECEFVRTYEESNYDTLQSLLYRGRYLAIAPKGRIKRARWVKGHLGKEHFFLFSWTPLQEARRIIESYQARLVGRPPQYCKDYNEYNTTNSGSSRSNSPARREQDRDTNTPGQKKRGKVRPEGQSVGQHRQRQRPRPSHQRPMRHGREKVQVESQGRRIRHQRQHPVPVNSSSATTPAPRPRFMPTPPPIFMTLTTPPPLQPFPVAPSAARSYHVRHRHDGRRWRRPRGHGSSPHTSPHA
ncbi:hypothetical protein Pmani_028667 [Petrolisthes manimaculis]|uniref:Uncharacterized protein n=1 Tax=Petrolisthes manimaculis TaxID=1843537 RepID=A0AAE1TVF5_9EUCA|nr:hypothetical protein Pmani_028667 [Petrolisthes manimaculis]